MPHHHHHVSGKNLFITIVLNLFITVAQIVGGLLSGSLALLSDALHNFSDVLALVLAYFAHRLSHKQSSFSKTFGYKRAEVLAALFNTAVLVLVALFLIYESYQKFLHPEPIDSLLVVWLGVLSVFLNAISVLLIKDDAHHNMNIKAAYLHLATDMVTSLGVVFGGILIYFYNINWIDPLVSMLIALYLIVASVKLMKSTIVILMQFVPENIELQRVVERIKLTQEDIANIHHVHIWQLDDHHIHLEAHLEFYEDLSLSRVGEIIDALELLLENEFGISHVTLQCEYGRCTEKEVLV